MYVVEFTKSASKDLKKLPDYVQQRVKTALSSLRLDPFSELIRYRKIKGHDSLYRIRLGDYRLVYQVKEGWLLILVIRVGHRGDVYRGI